MIGIYLIEKILQTREIDKLFKINPKWLETDLEERVYNIALSYYYKYNSLPDSILKLHIDEIIPEQFFKEYDHNVTVDFYYGLLIDRYAKTLYQKIKNLKPPKENIDNIKKFLVNVYNDVSEYMNITQKLDAITYLSSEDIIDKTKEELKKFKINFVIGNIITTGFKTLDVMLGGGYNPSEVYVYVARLKMGKTMYLIRSALESLINEKNVLFVSMEMDFFQIMRRMFALIYKDNSYLSYKIMAKDIKFIEDDFRHRNFNFNFNYLNGMAVKNIKQLESYIDLNKYDIVFVDGAYLLNTFEKSIKSEWEKVKRVIESLKEIAMKHRIPIVCTYQFNRAALSSEDGPGVEHIAYSDAIAQTAGAVIGILSPSQRKKKNSNGNEEVVNADLIKIFRIMANRYGPTGEFNVNFDFQNMNFDTTDETFVEIDNYDEELSKDHEEYEARTLCDRQF